MVESPWHHIPGSDQLPIFIIAVFRASPCIKLQLTPQSLALLSLFLVEYTCRCHLHTHIWVCSTKTNLETQGKNSSDRERTRQAHRREGARRAYRKPPTNPNKLYFPQNYVSTVLLIPGVPGCVCVCE